MLSTWALDVPIVPNSDPRVGEPQKFVGGPLAVFRADRKKCILFSSLLPFPFPLPRHCSLSSERVMGPSSCSMYDWEDSHSLPSPTTFSASKIAIAYATTPLALQLPPRSNPPIFKRTDGMIPQVSWCAVQNYLCLVMDVQIVVNQRREKKE